MRIAVTGSIATDYLMTFPGRFSDVLVADRLEQVSLSFLVDDLTVRRGGVAANVSVGLARLGLRPVLLGAVGNDFDEYRAFLESVGVDTRFVLVSPTKQSVRFLCTTDQEQNQIATFYAGAMTEARNIELAGVEARAGGLDLVLVGPNDPQAMARHTAECRQRGYAFAADPSQQLARLEGEEIRHLVDQAAYLFTNAYEHALLNSKTGWDDSDVLARVGCWVTTDGEAGARIERAGEPPLVVPAVPAEGELEPTGVGDGFRAGFLAGLASGVDLEHAAQLGCALATVVIESEGPQEYHVDAGRLLDRIARSYGQEASSLVARHVHVPARAPGGLAGAVGRGH